ncbi:hypothetical protein M9Y10_043669 [Tritrichomonas musculus]|uniref:PHD-type domain-containing protein n=1 Tax=Tritrichomonas musculus TaxID=1915356 RepID=A0ABR2K393_9EUKA
MKNANVFEQQQPELQQLHKQQLTNVPHVSPQINTNEATAAANNFQIRLPSIQNITYGNSFVPPSDNIIPRSTNLPLVSISSNNVKTENPMLIQPPNPIYTFDSNNQPIRIRCTCKEGATDCLLLRCSICGYYVHAKCVGIARLPPGAKYVCPYCGNRPLRCICNHNDKYDEPIIQCTKCHYWVHKSCAGFTFGINPKGFLCDQCGTPTYHLPKPFFSEKSLCIDQTSDITPEERFSIINKLPNGEFKDFVVDDLNKSEFPFRDTMIRYVDEFAPCLFNYSHEFWKHFATTLSDILHCKKIDIINAIDELVVSILYKPLPASIDPPVPHLFVSDSIRSNVESESLTRYESIPSTKPIYVTNDMAVCTETPIENNGFICEIYGILCHEDEIDATNGIPRNCFNILNTKVAINASGNSVSQDHHDNDHQTANDNSANNDENSNTNDSSNNKNNLYEANQAVCFIKRSFNFNCIVRLFRFGGEVRAGLFGVRAKGPLSEERVFKPQKKEKDAYGSIDADEDAIDKMKKALLAIPKGGELFLPLDADIPYSVLMPIWKEKKVRGHKNVNVPAVENSNDNVETDQDGSNINDDNNSAQQKKGPGKKRKRKNTATRRKKTSKSSSSSAYGRNKDDDDNDDENGNDDDDGNNNDAKDDEIDGNGSSDNENANDNDSDIYTNRRNSSNKSSTSNNSKRRTSKANLPYSRATKVETRAMRTRAREEFPFSLTLLSAFQEDACPPIPIVLKDQKEIDEENPDPSSIRARLRNPHHKRIVY